MDRANLVQSWIPALDGVEAKLRAGAAAHIRRALADDGTWLQPGR